MKQTAQAAFQVFDIFLDGISRKCSDPVNMTEQEVRSYMESLRQSPNTRGEFYHVGSVTTVQVRHQVNSQKFLPLGAMFTANEYISLIHPNYIVGYVKWATAVYAFMDKISRTHDFMRLGLSFRIIFPLRFRDESYYWTLMEARPLQVDKNNNMVTHLNKYVRLTAYDTKFKYPLHGEILGEDHFNAPEWMRELYDQLLNNADSFLHLTPAERKILDIKFKNQDFTIRDIAQRLGRDEETIRAQRRSILAKAKKSFPNLEVKGLKELVIFLEPYGYWSNLV